MRRTLEQMASILTQLFLHVLVLYIVVPTYALKSNEKYPQDLSFRSIFSDTTPISNAFSSLPFKSFTSNNQGNLIYAQSSQIPPHCSSCFLALSPDKINIYASHYNGTLSIRNKISLMSPYTAWQHYFDIYTLNLYLPSVDDKAIMLLQSNSLPRFNSSDSFYIITQSNIVAVRMRSRDGESCGCSSIGKSDIRTILPTSQSGSAMSWGAVTLSAASFQNIWLYSSDRGLLRVDISTGDIENFTLSSYGLTGIIFTALKFIAKRNQLIVGTNLILYTLTFFPSGKLKKEEHEWITGVIDSAPLDFSYDESNDNLWLAQANAVHKRDSAGRWYRYGYHQNGPFISSITSVTVINGYVWVGSSIGLARFSVELDPSQADSLHISTQAISSEVFLSGSSISTANYFQHNLTPRNIQQTQTRSRANSGSSKDPWKWKFYGGHRYLPDNNVVALVPSSQLSPNDQNIDSAVMVVTSLGITLMYTSLWNLDEKAEAMQSFQYPRHDRLKLTSAVNLAKYGDFNSYAKRVDDNDGLWTSMHGMGEAYNYAVTRSEEAKAEAWTAFEGLEMLHNVTGGYPKYPARTFCNLNQVPIDQGCPTDPDMVDNTDDWHNSINYPGYRWKGDTSSDETDGHFAVMPLIYDLVAETPDEKQRVYNLIDGFTSSLVLAGLYLIDPTTNLPTTWGFWNPKQLNDDPDHYSERAPNSLGILGYLASAYSITRKEIYRVTYLDLLTNHSYAKNCLNVKIDNPDDNNHSDNELISLSFHTLFYAYERISDKNEPQFKEEMRLMVSPMLPAAMRTWQIIGSEFSPLWTGIFAGLIKLPVSQEYIDYSAWSLANWALDLIDWPIDNSNRADCEMSPFIVRGSVSIPVMRMIRPPMERTSSQWNNDPFASIDGSGWQEFNPAIYRFPYFLMKYYKLI